MTCPSIKRCQNAEQIARCCLGHHVPLGEGPSIYRWGKNNTKPTIEGMVYTIYGEIGGWFMALFYPHELVISPWSTLYSSIIQIESARDVQQSPAPRNISPVSVTKILRSRHHRGVARLNRHLEVFFSPKRVEQKSGCVWKWDVTICNPPKSNLKRDHDNICMMIN